MREVVSKDDVAGVRESLDMAHFVDGKMNAAGAAARAKHNLQLQRPEAEPMPLVRLLIASLVDNRVMRAYALPKVFAAPIYGKYEVDMRYGVHVDAAVLTGDRPIRTDLSVTLFLGDPADYDGGELVIESVGGPRSFKLPAGDAVVYPTFALHELKEVTRGVRLVAVTLRPSLVRDGPMRRVLFDLSGFVESLESSAPDSAELRLAVKALSNLQRLVVEFQNTPPIQGIPLCLD